jgi:ankyrin repeat protein
MFPNPQDALPLPTRSNLEQYKKLAKELVKACKSSQPDAIRAWALPWIETLVRLSGLTIGPRLPVRIERWVEQVTEFARRKLKSSDSGETQCRLADAQFIIARVQGFESWPKFAKHLEGLSRTDSGVSQFELAADAIVTGDAATLERLLRENPDLIHARSTREHQATLLHYAAANGAEGYRQKTPQNAVQIAKILLEAGAEVEAEAQMYGGGATTLGLLATSVHPEQAGVQEAMLQLFLDYGAKMEKLGAAGNMQSAVVGCLANGRQKAAEFLAERGARLDLEGAAGVGRLDVVQSFFDESGRLKMNATKQQMERGFLWACEYGRNDVVEFLLQRGIDLQTQAGTGETGLHWAVIGGQLDTIKLLLARGASLETKNAYDGDALGQALWSAVNGDPGMEYVKTIELLLEAGAKIEDGTLAWLAQQKEGSSLLKQQIAEVLRRHGAKS